MICINSLNLIVCSHRGRGRCSIHSITINKGNIKFVELNSIWFGGHLNGIDAVENPTEVERKIFSFLQAARPDSEFICWYEPATGERGLEPDFVLFGNHQGLLVLEVKDWRIDQIEEELSSRNTLDA